MLECSVSVGYGDLVVARDIEMALEPNDVVALLGPNGAGKTTFLLTVAGFLPPLEGSIRMDGQTVKPGSARRMNRAGVVLVPDSRALFTTMTALENLKLASKTGQRGVDDVFDLFPPLKARAKVAAGMLSGGEQQMLAIARALVQQPRVLLVDEMSMGLAPVIVEELLPAVRRIADEMSTAVILVEQHVALALEVADRAVVLVHGDVTLSGPADMLRDDPTALEAAYMGATITAPHG